MTALIILIWLVGSVVSYIAARKYRMVWKNYSHGDRLNNIEISFFLSWIWLIIIGIKSAILFWKQSLDNPAKW